MIYNVVSLLDMSRRGGLGGSNRGSIRRSKWEQGMIKEDATKIGFHANFIQISYKFHTNFIQIFSYENHS